MAAMANIADSICAENVCSRYQHPFAFIAFLSNLVSLNVSLNMAAFLVLKSLKLHIFNEVCF
jgi:hypothetical protein